MLLMIMIWLVIAMPLGTISLAVGHYYNIIMLSPIRAAFLETDIPLPSTQVTIACSASDSNTLIGWSHSPGTDVVTDLLDTSPSKYMVNGNTLTITNIDRTDEGIYRCIYEEGSTIEQCIYVYGEFICCKQNCRNLHTMSCIY